MKLQPGQHIFLVGIGGSGLSAIARVLLGQGYKVSGSDRSLNSLTEALERDGAAIYKGHDAAQINGADALIITSAVKDDHVEVAAAYAAGIPVYKRQDIMADLMEGKTVIAVAGTKGKTTTTSMIVHILKECGQDPSYIVGGIMGNIGTNAGVGKGDAFVVEADEYDNMFLGLKPDIAVITNIEWDHPDFFKAPEDMIESFVKFAKLALHGAKKGDLSKCNARSIILCQDNPGTFQIAYDLMRARIPCFTTYSAESSINISIAAENVTVDESGNTVFDLSCGKGIYSNLRLPLTGKHNVLNALASYAVCDSDAIMISPSIAAKALETFKPTARRFDVRADVKGIAIVDDYAHNPMSIKAVIEAAKQRYPDRALWAVWQPHTYSRTQALFDQFVTAFDEADHVLITDIYAAREASIEGVNSAMVVKAMKHKDVRHTATFGDAVKVLHGEVQAPAVIVIMSAGDAPEIGVAYLKLLQRSNSAE